MRLHLERELPETPLWQRWLVILGLVAFGSGVVWLLEWLG
jgi:hypothetical protein